MKKIYLSLFLFIVTLTAQAGDRVWNFYYGFPVENHSSFSLSSPVNYTTAKQVALDETSWSATLCAGTLVSGCEQGLELCPNFKIAGAAKADSAYFFKEFGGRMQLYGFTSPNVPPTIPTENYFSFNVDGDVTVKFYLNPKLDGALTLNVINTTGSLVGTMTTSALGDGLNLFAEEPTFEYTGPATTLTFYPTYTNLTSMYIYAIQVTDVVATSTENAIESTFSLKKVGSQLQNDEGASVEVYSITGSKVLSSTETRIDIAGLSSGVYIARTPTGSMKFMK